MKKKIKNIIKNLKFKIKYKNFFLSKYQIKDFLHMRRNLKMKNKDFDREVPEQIMAFIFISKNNKVLEIGSNVGRNSLIISSLLKESSNLVTLECNPDISKLCQENRDINGLNFSIETSALSKKPLIQKNWDTIPSEILLPGYTKINIISWDMLCQKYKINFDTLVLDCEGAFYYILEDFPNILNNIKLIIMENDYHNIDHYKTIKNKLNDNGFKNIYTRNGGWGPCKSFFYQVWKKE